MEAPTLQKISIGKRKNQGKRSGVVSTQVEIRSRRSKCIQVAGAQVAGDVEAVEVEVEVEVAKILLTEMECFINSKK